MEWLAIIGLAALAWWQSGRINALTHKLNQLESRLGAPAPAPAATAHSFPPTPAPGAPHPANTEELEPLLLDTPLPDVSNDTDESTPLPPREEPVLLLTKVVPDDVVELDTPIPHPPAAATPPPRVLKVRERKLEQWLAENGLAWLGGGTAALAAIFLVSLASQQDWFTPQVQLLSAVVLGLVFLAASEWARRAETRRPPGHPLVAAMLAGAGVVTFYATAWAGHSLYALIDWPIAAALLTLCAAILIGLSFLHGQALGMLAIGMALLTPPFASVGQWPPPALTIYVFAVGAAGFGLAAVRRWSWVAVTTIVGLYYWFGTAINTGEVQRALILASVAALGGLALAFRKPVPEEAPAQLPWTRLHAHLPGVAICASAVVMIAAWLAIAPLPSGVIAGPAWVSAIFVALAAAAVRARFATPAVFTIAVGALVYGFIGYLRQRFYTPSLGVDFYPFILFASLVVAVSALGAKPHRTGRALIAATGAIGAALLTAVAAFSRDDWHHYSAWTPLFIGAAILFGTAWHNSRDAADARTDRAVGFWVAAAGALVLLGIESAFPTSVRTAAHAGAALLFACGLAWRGWGMLRLTALTAAALAIGHALSPDLIGATLAGTIPLGGGLTILATSAALLFGASYMSSRQEPRAMSSEALSGAGVIVILIGVFLALRWIAAGGASATLDAFTEASLRALALIAAGHVLLPRANQELGRIGAWRGHVLMAAGLLYVLFIPGMAINPWWGPQPALVTGPPFFDTSLLAFGAPAALAFAASNRLYTHQRFAARIYAATGGLFALIWALLAVRRAFHGAEMASAPVGLFEGGCYALVCLAGALAVAIVARMRAARDAERPFTHDLLLISRGIAWTGLIVAGYILLVSRHPWWGAQDASNALSTLLAVGVQAFAVVLALFLGRALSRSRKVEPTRFAAASAALLFGWSFGHVAIRWFYHRGYMDDGPVFSGLEGIAHSLWPLAFILFVSAIVARAPNRDTTRPYTYDLQAICAAAVWPTLGFAGLGLWQMFNPWWGPNPPPVGDAMSAALALAGYGAGAAMSAASPRVPHVRAPEWFARAATIATTAHLLVGTTLVVRWIYHRADMTAPGVTNAEMWVYSAVWALFGAAAFALGMRRGAAMLRWIGLGLLVGTWLYVMALAFTRLTGVAQVGSMIGLAIVLLVVAWLARTNRLEPRPADPGALLTITPSARRERRHGRRQRSS